MTARIVVLGAPDVHSAAGPCLLGPRLRRLLGILVANRDQHLRTATLVDRVWPGDAPGSGEAALRVQITRLRRHLGSPESILTMPGRGYRLNVEVPGLVELDSDRFCRALERGDVHAAAGDHSAAADSYRSALAMWSGAAFDGCDDDPDVRTEQAHLETLRQRARRSLARALVTPGGCVDADADLTELQMLTADQPGDEELVELVMDAFERLGRTVEALRAFQRIDGHLRAELGVGPSPKLQAVADRLSRASGPPPPV